MSTSVNTAARVFRLPDLGEGLTEAGLVQWLVAVGDTIATDQAIAEVETAKSVVELPSPFAGVVVALHGTPGDTIDVGAPVLEVADPDVATTGSPSGSSAEAASGSSAMASSGSSAEAAGGPAEHEAYRQEERAGSGNVLIGYGTSAASTKGRRRPRATRPGAPARTSDHAPSARASAPADSTARSASSAAASTPGGSTPASTAAGPASTAAGPASSAAASASAGSIAADPTSTDSASAPAIPASDATPAAAVARPTAQRPVAVRSPLVRRLARDLGLDVHAITPTGVDGAITRADVLRAAVDLGLDSAASAAVPAANPAVSSESAAVPGTNPASSSASAAVPGANSASTDSGPTPATDELDGLAVRSRERLSPLRRAVSAKLARSRSEIPEATVWVDVDATALWELRTQMAPEGGKAPSITALLARFVLLALEEYPVLASRLSDDAAELISFEGVNLGVAADTERGLLVPVLPRAHALTVAQLDTALRELAATARAGTMPPERLRGSTFTLNNYGGLGVDGSAAIINHPDVAILGIGRIIERPWVVDGAIVARRIAQLSLVFDHRVCDGGYAAGFLRRVTELIEHPLRAFGRV